MLLYIHTVYFFQMHEQIDTLRLIIHMLTLNPDLFNSSLSSIRRITSLNDIVQYIPIKSKPHQ